MENLALDLEFNIGDNVKKPVNVKRPPGFKVQAHNNSIMTLEELSGASGLNRVSTA